MHVVGRSTNRFYACLWAASAPAASDTMLGSSRRQTTCRSNAERKTALHKLCDAVHDQVHSAVHSSDKLASSSRPMQKEQTEEAKPNDSVHNDLSSKLIAQDAMLMMTMTFHASHVRTGTTCILCVTGLYTCSLSVQRTVLRLHVLCT